MTPEDEWIDKMAEAPEADSLNSLQDSQYPLNDHQNPENPPGYYGINLCYVHDLVKSKAVGFMGFPCSPTLRRFHGLQSIPPGMLDMMVLVVASLFQLT